MTRLVLLSLFATGCMHFTEVSSAPAGGVTFVAQKRFLGFSGTPRLVHCQSNAADCVIIASGPMIQDMSLGTMPSPSYGTSGVYSPFGLDGFDGFDGFDDYDDYDYGGGSATCPEGAFTGDRLEHGTKVSILAIHPDDAYSGSEWEARLPLPGRVDGDMHNNGGCWFGGGFDADSGADFYFYKAAIIPDGA